MRGERLSERTMSHAKLDMLIDYYLGDMERRGCTHDSVTTNRKALRRFCKYVDPDAIQLTLTEVSEETVETYVTGLQHRTVRWKDHPRRSQEAGCLSPFTIRKEARILKGSGTWLQQEGIENPFGSLVVPKEPKHLVKVLNDDDIDRIFKSINPQTPIGSRLYGIVLFLLDSGPRIGGVANARLRDLNLESRQIRIVGKGDKERIVPFGTRTGNAFLNYIRVHRPTPLVPENEHLFLSMDGMPMTRHSLESTLGRLKRTSGVERLHGHLFRHTFAVGALAHHLAEAAFWILSRQQSYRPPAVRQAFPKQVQGRT